MDEKLEFTPDNQGQVAEQAASIYSEIEGKLPRVPWFSHSGQQQAYTAIFELCAEEAEKINASEKARLAITFWALVLIYANKRTFRPAIASVKRSGGYGLPKIAQDFAIWAGENTHPGVPIAQNIDSWITEPTQN
ncbi:hypothetical protein [Thalassospira australica]|uniref:hypothetical protein n=1 Tax=Thalassospira australica TaxID=1528106 RepID=UPI00051A355D|nr:hypothetical protein [Thalassospira australica]